MLLKLNKQAEVSEQQQVRWSHVYRLFPAEAGKKVRYKSCDVYMALNIEV